MHNTPALGRPADRRMEIVRELRQQIVDGSLQPGSQVPTRLEIETRFAVSPLTVQRALQQLREDGFITVNGRQGTYVAKHPPHLSNFALIFPHLPNTPSWVRFWTALDRQAAALELPTELKLRTFHNINRDVGNEAYEELSREVQSHRVAGLIFATSPHLLKNTPILDEPGIPRVAIQTAGEDKAYPVIDLDRRGWLKRALSHVQERGCRRVAYIGQIQTLKEREQLREQAAVYGLDTHPYWWQGISIGMAEMAQTCTHLLMNPHQSLRPDALIIGDDNLVDHAMKGLIEAGVQVPEDMEIVAHANFPCEVPNILPCRRLGFDNRQVLNACIEAVLMQRRGQEPPAVTMIPPVFEDELE